MLLTAWISSWELEDDRRILQVGEEFRSWLTFEEAGRWPIPPPAGSVKVIQGKAAPLPSWPGAEDRRYPVQINIGGGALYWDAPEPVIGPIEVAGTVSTNFADAPDDFPETSGVLRSIRMMWREYVVTPRGSVPTRTVPRHADVNATYFPVSEPEPPDPQAEAEMARRARQAYEREVAAGRLRPGEPFSIVLSRPSRQVPVGSLEVLWIGALLDLEVAESGDD